MAKIKSGYTRAEDDKDNVCYYCQQEAKYTDYVPSRDVFNNPELKALVTVPFMYVSVCHNCKTGLYPKRYDLLTPETRRAWFLERKGMKSSALDGIATKLRAQTMHSWQIGVVNGAGEREITDLPDYALEPAQKAAKEAFFAAKAADTKDFDLGF